MTPSSVFSAPTANSDLSVVRALAEPEIDCCRQLDESTERAWQALLAGHGELRSGYFHPEFFRAVQRVRQDVELAVVRQEGSVSALLPFQRVNSRLGQPVGGMMNDFHGVITAPGTRFDFPRLMRGAGINRFDFHALATANVSGQTHSKQVFDVLECPYIDLSDGLPAYQAWLLAHSSTVRRQPQKARAMTRALGPLRLEFDVRDAQVLERLIQWKRERYRRTRTFDLLSVDWTANLLREVFQTEANGFRGLLSGLWAGSTLVAAHFGFVCGSVLHYWFPAYDPTWRRFSPGTELMKAITQACYEHPIDRIDLGSGDSDLKDRFANRSSTVEVGCFGLNGLSRELGFRRYQMRQWLKRAPLKETLKRVIRPLCPNLGQNRFR